MTEPGLIEISAKTVTELNNLLSFNLRYQHCHLKNKNIENYRIHSFITQLTLKKMNEHS